LVHRWAVAFITLKQFLDRWQAHILTFFFVVMETRSSLPRLIYFFLTSHYLVVVCWYTRASDKINKEETLFRKPKRQLRAYFLVKHTRKKSPVFFCQNWSKSESEITWQIFLDHWANFQFRKWGFLVFFTEKRILNFRSFQDLNILQRPFAHPGIKRNVDVDTYVFYLLSVHIVINVSCP
jgi:hypothetical protein